MELKHFQKKLVQDDFKKRIEETGGTYIGINWKKQKIHYVTPQGKRDSRLISFETRKV